MEQKAALRSYTELKRELALFESLHAKTVEAHASLLKRVLAAEEELKAATREAGEGIENRYFDVRLAPKERRWYDYETLIGCYPQAEHMPGVVNVTIDREVVDRLVEHRLIPAEAAEKAQCAEPMTAAVYVRSKQALVGPYPVKTPRARTAKKTTVIK